MKFTKITPLCDRASDLIIPVAVTIERVGDDLVLFDVGSCTLTFSANFQGTFNRCSAAKQQEIITEIKNRIEEECEIDISCE
ncbi:hypothetical protein [Bacillus sp. JJ722]|uniref:hypothetical protein n=1 Tax=Bacillus sp. JJ722 TaxID=3122973 RepID=UPI002FFF6572